MEAGKEDRRIRRTKRAIRDAFLHLMEEKTAAQISTTELCKEADINRSTFYAHYSSPEDVLVEIEDEFLSNINAMLDESCGTEDITVALLKDIDNGREQWHALWHGDPDLIARALDLCCKRTLAVWNKDNVAKEGEGALFLQYITRGASGVVGSWLDDGCRLSPDQLGEIVNRFVFKGQEGVRP